MDQPNVSTLGRGQDAEFQITKEIVTLIKYGSTNG